MDFPKKKNSNHVPTQNTVDGSELLLTSWGWQFIPLFTGGFRHFSGGRFGFLNHQHDPKQTPQPTPSVWTRLSNLLCHKDGRQLGYFAFSTLVASEKETPQTNRIESMGWWFLFID